jgi:glycosyltransferase involved in cell wall biosynthesis
VWLPEELPGLLALGERIVVSQLDLIAYNNPGYFSEWSVWTRHREAIRRSLAAADGVAFISRHAMEEVRDEGLLAPGKPTAVTYCGTDHLTADVAPAAPAALPHEIAAEGFVLCLGTDFLHKNRPFALRVFERMVALGYRGHLVLAGLPVELGSSRAVEADYLHAHPEVAARTVTLGAVTEAERAWLYQHTRLVLHPTLYEGFGLVPFEAAAAGAPCLSSRQGSLAEVLPDGIEAIDDWDAEAAAARALAILAAPAARDALVEAVRARGAAFTWDRVAASLVELFESVMGAPRVARAEAPDLVLAPLPQAPVLVDALGGMIDGYYPDDFKEALRAIGQRERLRRPLVAVGVFFYRLASRLRSSLAGTGGDQS